jgi:membrane protease YdiL (CAAX protease family)
MDQTLKRWLCVFPALVSPSIAALGYIFLIHAGWGIRVLYCAQKSLAVFWPLLAGLWILREVPRIQGRPNQDDLRALPLGALLGLLAGTGILLGYWFSPLGPIVNLSAAVIRAKLTQAGILEHMVPFAVVMSLLHSALEEYQWRWFVYGNLKKLLKPFWARQLAAWSFASHHFIILFFYFPPWAALLGGCGVVIAGLAWQGMMEGQRSLAGAWLSHALVDGAIFAVALQILRH